MGTGLMVLIPDRGTPSHHPAQVNWKDWLQIHEKPRFHVIAFEKTQ